MQVKYGAFLVGDYDATDDYTTQITNTYPLNVSQVETQFSFEFYAFCKTPALMITHHKNIMQKFQEPNKDLWIILDEDNPTDVTKNIFISNQVSLITQPTGLSIIATVRKMNDIQTNTETSHHYFVSIKWKTNVLLNNAFTSLQCACNMDGAHIKTIVIEGEIPRQLVDGTLEDALSALETKTGNLNKLNDSSNVLLKPVLALFGGGDNYRCNKFVTTFPESSVDNLPANLYLKFSAEYENVLFAEDSSNVISEHLHNPQISMSIKPLVQFRPSFRSDSNFNGQPVSVATSAVSESMYEIKYLTTVKASSSYLNSSTSKTGMLFSSKEKTATEDALVKLYEEIIRPTILQKIETLVGVKKKSKKGGRNKQNSTPEQQQTIEGYTILSETPDFNPHALQIGAVFVVSGDSGLLAYNETIGFSITKMIASKILNGEDYSMDLARPGKTGNLYARVTAIGEASKALDAANEKPSIIISNNVEKQDQEVFVSSDSAFVSGFKSGKYSYGSIYKVVTTWSSVIVSNSSSISSQVKKSAKDTPQATKTQLPKGY